MIYFRLMNPYRLSKIEQEAHSLGASKHRLVRWTRFFCVTKPCEQTPVYHFCFRKSKTVRGTETKPFAVKCGLFEAVTLSGADQSTTESNSDFHRELTTVLRRIILQDELAIILSVLWLVLLSLQYFGAKTKNVLFLACMVLFFVVLLFKTLDFVQANSAIKQDEAL